MPTRNDLQPTGELCPACEREVMLTSTDLGAALVECDCGTAGILSAA